MKQLLTSAQGIKVVEVPAPKAGDRSLLVRVEHSCISVGTEIAGVRAASEPLYRRALRQPEKIRRAIELFREKGVAATIERVRSAGSGVQLGYSAAGVVLECGPEVSLFSVGDRVACAGAGIANHAEVIEVPVNLAVKIPGKVETAEASTVALGAIALQGVRRAAPALGETVLVVGLGILGQLTVQLLKSSGCKVIGADLIASRAAVAAEGGMDWSTNPDSESHIADVHRLTDGHGADAVIVTAATKNSSVINNAIRACRRKGRVVIVGDVGLNVDRAELYAREVDLLISTSYGPGRYDSSYELEGRDYPFPYVRWTENRNMEAYLAMVDTRQVRLESIPTKIYEIDDAVRAYHEIQSADSDALLYLLRYGNRPRAESRSVQISAPTPHSGRIRVALVGAGSFAQGMHLPNLTRSGSAYALRAIMSRNGATARTIAERFGATVVTTDVNEAISDPDIDLVIIATRHHLHAPLVLKSLAAGKHVFVEKPLALSEADLNAIEGFFADRQNAPVLMTGFNRRFSTPLLRTRALMAARQGPAILNYRVNAGYLPANHWVHGDEGGGRNIGEACHIYDACNFLVGTLPQQVHARSIAPAGKQLQRNDNFVVTLCYPEGSVCSITYTALGASAYPKERMEIFVDGMVIALDDYKSLTVTGARGKNWASAAPDKGHAQELLALANGIRHGAWPISLPEQIAATRTSFEVEKQIRGMHSAAVAGV